MKRIHIVSQIQCKCTEPKSYFLGGLLCALIVPDHSMNLLPKLEQVQLAPVKLEKLFTFKLPGLSRVIPKEGSSESEPLNQ